MIKSEALKEEYTLIRHKSGLKIYVFPKKTTGTYALFATHYGSIDNGFKLVGDEKETVVPDGIAHFLEHKMFTSEDGGDAFDLFSELGADANAYTSYDKTVFLFNTVSGFDKCLDILLDFVTHPYFTEDTIAKEQGIIAEEIGMYDDNPSTRSYYGMLDGLYVSHEIKKNICGSVKSISEITPKLLYRCHEVFYDPENMVLAVCGDVSADAVERAADKLGTSADRKGIIRKRVYEPESINRAYTEIKMQVAKPIFSIGIKDTDIPSSAEARMERDILVSIAGDLLFSQTGELYEALYRDGLISPGLEGSYTLSESFGFYSISGESDDPRAVLERIKAFIRQKKETGFTEEEFERCRKVFYANFVREFDSAEYIADDLVSFAFNGYDLFGYADAISSVPTSKANELLSTFFDEERFTLSVVLPCDK